MKKDKAVTLGISADASGPAASTKLSSTRSTTTRVNNIDRWMMRRLYALFDDPPFHLVLWNGEEIVAGETAPVAKVAVRDRRALYQLLSSPNLYFGDLYSAGRIEVEGDLLTFLEAAYRAMDPSTRIGRLNRIIPARFKRGRASTLARSRHNIHHHYDIGNDFYRMWLDRDYLQYTCGYYPLPDMSLEQAQTAKLEHICRKLELKPGQSVVEAGCGWGGLARYMAKHYGVRVRAYNISHQQILYARELAKAKGLEGQVEYVEDDYRNISGRYDVFVSIGMLEHVGHAQYETLGGVIDRCLKNNGRGLIHSIGRNKPAQMDAWIDKRIFPGAYPPSLREFIEILEPWNFSVLDIENLRLHYARTLEHWLQRYEARAKEVEAMYDRMFLRAWRLYLTGSIAAFRTGQLQLFQALFTRHDNNDVRYSRAHLYKEPIDGNR